MVGIEKINWLNFIILLTPIYFRLYLLWFLIINNALRLVMSNQLRIFT